MGQINEKFALAFRDFANAGLPASGPHEPIKREIRAIALPIEAGIAAAAIAGGDLEEAAALIQPLLQSAQAAQAAAENSATTAANLAADIPDQINDAVSAVITAAADIPAFSALISAGMEKRARLEARAALYGIADEATARLWGAEATEVAFSDDVYRDGYATAASFSALPDIDTAGPVPIDGRGLLVEGETAVGVVRPAPGDVTFIVEVDMPAFDGTQSTDGTLRVLGSYVGDVLESRVVVFRSVTGIYALQVYNGVQGIQTIGDLQDYSARRMKVAVTVGPKLTKASFDGRPPVASVADHPATLLRLWFGRLAKGQGDPLNGRVLRSAIYPFAVDDELLRAMSGADVTDDEVTALIEERIATHDSDSAAHGLVVTRADLERADSKTGLWTTKAADDFNGADGPLTTTPTGGFAWTAIGGNQLSRIGNVARTPDNTLRGSYVQAGVPNGQVEADLAPGNNEASLYIRFQSNGNYLLLQRKPEGFIGLYRFVSGASTIISPASIYRAVVAGERFKVRFVGPRIWVFRVVSGVEELLFDVTEPAFQTVGSHGLRLAGTGSADNFRILNREAL